jgi:hypothetical protein
MRRVGRGVVAGMVRLLKVWRQEGWEARQVVSQVRMRERVEALEAGWRGRPQM